MERRIELETRGRPPHEIKSLNIDNCRSNGYIDGLSSEFTALSELSLINTGLTSLKKFPQVLRLQRLELAENRLSSGLHILERVAPNVRYLNISGNRFKTWSSLEALKELKDLRYLEIGCDKIMKNNNNFESDFSSDLAGTDMTGNDLSEKVFDFCPQIKAIDGKDRNGLPKSYEQALMEGELEKRLSPILDGSKQTNRAKNNSGGSNSSVRSGEVIQSEIPVKKRKVEADYNPSSSSETESEDDENDSPRNASDFGANPLTFHANQNLQNSNLQKSTTQNASSQPEITQNSINPAQTTVPTSQLNEDYDSSDDDSDTEDHSQNSVNQNIEPQHIDPQQLEAQQLDPPNVQPHTVAAPQPSLIQVTDINGQVVTYQIPAGMDPNTFLAQIQQQQIMVANDFEENENSDDESEEESEDEYADRREDQLQTRNVNEEEEEEEDESDDDEDEIEEDDEDDAE